MTPDAVGGRQSNGFMAGTKSNPKARFMKHGDVRNAVADGRYLAHLRNDGLVVRDGTTFAELRVLKDGTKYFDFSPSSREVVIGVDNEIRIFDVESGEIARTSAVSAGTDAKDPFFKTGSYREGDLAWSPDGKSIAACMGGGNTQARDRFGILLVVDSQTGARILEKAWDDRNAARVSWSQSPSRLAVSFEVRDDVNAIAEIYTLGTGEVQTVPRGVYESANRMDWNSTKSLLVAASSRGGNSEFWDTSKLKKNGTSCAATFLRWSPDDQTLALARWRSLMLWDFDSQVRRTCLWGVNCTSVGWHPRKDRIALAESSRDLEDSDRVISIWDLDAIEPHFVEYVQPPPYRSSVVPYSFSVLSWRPGHDELAAMDQTGRLSLLGATKTYKPHSFSSTQTFGDRTTPPDKGKTHSLAWNHDGTLLLTQDGTGTLTCRTVEKHGEEFDVRTKWTTAEQTGQLAVISSDIAVAAGDSGTLHLYRLHDGQQIQSVPSGFNKIQAIAVDTRSRRIVIAGQGRGLVAATLESDGLIDTTPLTIDGMAVNGVVSMDILYGGSRTAVALQGGVILLFEAGQPSSPKEISGHQDGVKALAWNRDGSRLASADGDGTLRIWDPVTLSQVATVDEKLWAGAMGRSYVSLLPSSLGWNSTGQKLAVGGHAVGWGGFHFGTIQILSASPQ